YWPAISTPVVIGDRVIVPVGRDDRRGQSRIHAVKLGGNGDVTGTHRAWERNDIGVFVPALAVHDGKVILLRNRGEIVCLDPKSGDTVWSGALPEGRSSYYASPLIVNDVLYAAREDGV
ncbi:MAG TPA: Pyrrolo-quinoline quinone, partial [Verrucomicrobiales bacterium]|nr:Pyrrolo-quinoline quinone [Verrucomicrobiales bacterium]